MSIKNGNYPWNEAGTPALRLVICGSMTFYAQMRELQDTLRSKNIKSYLPDAEDEVSASLNPEQFSTFKRRVSLAHLRRIRSPETFGILAVNLDKHGIPDYIGANTFAEIAVAFAQHKRIYLLQGIPRMYEDELKAWKVVPLHGDLRTLVSEYRETSHTYDQQGVLFEGR